MKIDRLIAILFILLNRDHITAKELADKFEVSTRTIYRDLDTLLYSGFPILTKQGNSGGVCIDSDYKLDKNFFSSDELSSLLIGLGGVSSALQDTAVTAAYEKIKALIPESESDVLNETFEQVFIDLMKWQEYGDAKQKLQLIRKGMKEKYLVKFSYFDKNGKESHRTVEPYRVTLKEMNWYLEGYCLDKSDFRMFKLSRMHHIEVEKTRFEKREFEVRDHSREGWIKNRLFNIDVEFNSKIYDQMAERCGGE